MDYKLSNNFFSLLLPLKYILSFGAFQRISVRLDVEENEKAVKLCGEGENLNHWNAFAKDNEPLTAAHLKRRQLSENKLIYR